MYVYQESALCCRPSLIGTLVAIYYPAPKGPQMVTLVDVEEYWKDIAPHDLFPSPGDDEVVREIWIHTVPRSSHFRTHMTHALSLKPGRTRCLGTGRRCCIVLCSACTARPMVAYRLCIALSLCWK